MPNVLLADFSLKPLKRRNAQNRPAFGAILGVFIGNEWSCGGACSSLAGKAGAFTVSASVQQRNLPKQVGIFLAEL